jgi:hypothetical protein
MDTNKCAKNNDTTFPLIESTVSIKIGKQFIGQIRDFRLLSDALTPQEILFMSNTASVYSNVLKNNVL